MITFIKKFSSFIFYPNKDTSVDNPNDESYTVAINTADNFYLTES